MNTTLPAAVPAPGQPRTSMDELMLAMDIVDTLRHEQSLVERELASTQRDEDFVARVRQIYASQGIEVSEALVRQGVEALKQDRFAYVPPKRTLAVRLAEVWVERGRWAKRAMIAGFVGVFGYGLVAVPNAWMAGREYRGYAGAVAEVRDAASDLKRRDEALALRMTAWSNVPDLVATPVAAVRAAIASGRAALAPVVATAGAFGAVDAEAYAQDPEGARANLQLPRDALAQATTRLDVLEAEAARVDALIDAAVRLGQAEARVAGLDLSETAQSRLDELRAQSRALLASGDAAAAAATLATLEGAAAQVNLAYTLRIVNRDGVQSGVWRYHEDAPDGKNYYLVVEAIDANGQALALPITNEETQRIETVSLFALRVPPSEYEKVKADKLDNGLIDAPVVGEKRRGELDVDYRVAVSGGAITAW